MDLEKFELDEIKKAYEYYLKKFFNTVFDKLVKEDFEDIYQIFLLSYLIEKKDDSFRLNSIKKNIRLCSENFRKEGRQFLSQKGIIRKNKLSEYKQVVFYNDKIENFSNGYEYNYVR